MHGVWMSSPPLAEGLDDPPDSRSLRLARAWERHAQARLPRSYFDWQAHKRSGDKGRTRGRPPSTSSMDCKPVALMRDEGLERLFERHERYGRVHAQWPRRARAGLLAEPPFVRQVTTAYVPDGVAGSELLEAFAIARRGRGWGQGRLRAAFIRVAHLGWFDQDDLGRGGFWPCGSS